MEEIPLDPQAPLAPATVAGVAPSPERYKCVMARAIQRCTQGLVSVGWDSLSDDADLQLCIGEDHKGVRLVGTLAGTLEWWSTQLEERIAERYESYECREEETAFCVFRHAVNALGSRYSVAGLYQRYSVPGERVVRFIFVSDAEVAALHPVGAGAPVLDGVLGVWLRAADDEKRCEVHLVLWPDFHLSALEALLRVGMWGKLAAAVGRELKGALLKLGRDFEATAK